MRAQRVTFKRARRLRSELSLPEVVLWQHLRGSKVAGMRFRRQHPLGPYILDFYCPESHLCIEIDGSVHDNPEQATHDERRTQWLKTQGVDTLRFPASDILNDEYLEGVLKMIAAAPSTAVPAVPLPRAAGEDQQ